MYRENYINSLRSELLEIVADYLTPVALNYGYNEVPLEANIKWKPQVLVLGNYSSGKSTLINEFLGADIQATGQAPTDDSFTIITYDDSENDKNTIQVVEERDGKYLLNNPEYPFESLKKHGLHFASHFRLKKVNSPFLKNLAVIDTPGMLDSTTEKDRSYNYQEVIGDLAQNADLVLVLFDPHKAGTVREAHISLRETLPARTFENRVLFVLNRIDECASFTDLLRVYGTLCWNLSQTTGRKDIPMIHLTYSPRALNDSTNGLNPDRDYLHLLENQREELRKAVLQAPGYHLDNLATFVEINGERLSHFLESLISYRKKFQKIRVKYAAAGFFLSLLCGGTAILGLMVSGLMGSMDHLVSIYTGGAVSLAVFVLWIMFIQNFFESSFQEKQLSEIDKLTPLENQTRRDSWQAVRNLVYSYLRKTGGRFSLKNVKRDYATIRTVCDKSSHEIREGIRELATIMRNNGADTETGISGHENH